MCTNTQIHRALSCVPNTNWIRTFFDRDSSAVTAGLLYGSRKSFGRKPSLPLSLTYLNENTTSIVVNINNIIITLRDYTTGYCNNWVIVLYTFPQYAPGSEFPLSNSSLGIKLKVHTSCWSELTKVYNNIKSDNKGREESVEPRIQACR